MSVPVLTPPQVLRATADLLAPAGRWVQKADAYDKHGNTVPPTSPRAVCFCTFGAMCAVTGDEMAKGPGAVAWDFLVGKVFHGNVSWWNDRPERTQAEVVQTLRDAADRFEKEQAA